MSFLYVARWLSSKVQSKTFVSLQFLTFFLLQYRITSWCSKILSTIKSVMMVRSELCCSNSTSDKEHLLNFLVWWGWGSTGSF